MDFSIILPIYNVEFYLDQCLQSLEDLDPAKFEIIAVNDGSTDKSQYILEKWQHKMPNLIIVHQKNKGLSGARNTGLSNCTGKYVAFIDSDDYINSSALIRIFNQAYNFKTDITIGDFYEFNHGDNNFKLFSFKGDDNIVNGKEFFKKYYKPLKSMVWRNIYRKSYLLENNIDFKEGIYFEDILFTPLAFIKAPRVRKTNIPFYYYRKRDNSITTSNSSIKKLEDIFFIWSSLKKFCTENSTIFDVLNIVNTICFHLFLVQYNAYKYKISDGMWERLKCLVWTKYSSRKYLLIACLVKYTNQYVFHKINSSIIKRHLK